MFLLRKVTDFDELQNLIDYFILNEEDKFTSSDITKKVCENDFFNNFCHERTVSSMVSDSIKNFCKHNQLKYNSGYYQNSKNC